MEKNYVVTLYKRDDLEDFYAEMSSKGFRLCMKRAISRNTNYWMTEEQAEELKKDSRVWDVIPVDDFEVATDAIYNNTSYTKNGNFWKDDTVSPITISSTDFQWGHVHCAGSSSQRDKGDFGRISGGGTYEKVNTSVDVFNNGKHVDVVICDDALAYDSEEWYSPSSNTTRFVQYQWFNELNTYVNFIDDDAQTEPTGTITYHQNSQQSAYHGQHVAGTTAGQYYGWAREANIYSIAVTSDYASGQRMPTYLIFDYLRAFHLYKAVNSTTGRRNPTISNHSYGGLRYFNSDRSALSISYLHSIYYRGTTYTSSSPGPSGWTVSGVKKDFGVNISSNQNHVPVYNAAVLADVQDAIEDGVVIIGAAGNDNLMIADGPNDPDWNNFVRWNPDQDTSTTLAYYYHRGAWPNTVGGGSICVGNLYNDHQFKRSPDSQYGPGLDVFAPGSKIVSSFGNTGLSDSKYGSGNYYYPISGTSMAAPQVSGVAALLATAKYRYTNSDITGYIQRHSEDNDMTFDAGDGSHNDDSCQKNSPNKYLLAKNPRPTSGQIEDPLGERKTSGMVFPRRPTLNYQH